MIKTLLIEDEPNVRAALKKMLQLIEPSISVVAETGYVAKAIQLIEEHKPQLVFLDIELEDGTGFDLLQKLQHIDFKIIFTTAYNQYAIKAFKFSAMDYLLKPIDPLELKEAVSRTLATLKKEEAYQELLSNIDSEKPKKIVLKTTEQRFVLSVDEIIRLEADGAYTLFVTQKQNIIVSKNLKYYQEILDDSFVRCHQSHLVNTQHIISLKSDGLHLSNGDVTPVSTRKRSEILKIIAGL